NGGVTKWIIVMAIVADVGILVLCAYNIFQIMKIEDKLKAISGQTYVESSRDAQHWYCGGMFYYNPDDPALFLEKKVGYGYTMNFANKQVFLYIGYIALLAILVLVLATLGKL
ncbi:MAG: membrane protein, partial [bacterium]